jgi:IclR family pca regulon transcriptional regulator
MSASAAASTPTSARAGALAPGQAERTPPANTDRTFRSLQYGLGLLRLFTAERPVWGIAEMARALNVDRATAHRYAATCLELGYLEQTPARDYRLTRRCAEPGLAVLGALESIRAARPILRELRRQTGRTVGLAVLDGDQVLYLQRLRGFAHGQYRLEKGLGAGSRLPARDSAAGRALIEARPPERERAHASAPTPQIHARGLTVDEQDGGTGARGLAIAVAAGGDELASAIEITVPAESLSAAELVAELGEPLRAARARLVAALEALDGEQAEEERVA